MDLKIIELQKQLTPDERNTFNFKFSRLNKSTGIFAVLAFFLGSFGAHKFYVGEIGLGVLYALFFWTGIPGLVGFIETLFCSRIVDFKNYSIALEVFEEIKMLRQNTNYQLLKDKN